MSTDRTTGDIIRDARETLHTARFGLEDVRGVREERRIPGLRNFVVFSRAVTNILQNLRSSEPDFDDWYQPFVTEMRADPLIRYFYELRSVILKQGEVAAGGGMYIEDFDFDRDRHLWGDEPPNAVGMFLGDAIGGSGWVVRLPDGTEEPYYVSLPQTILRQRVHLPEAPLEHRGKRLTDTSVETLGIAYFKYLSDMLDAASARFLNV